MTTLIGVLNEAFDGPAWHGPSLKRSLRGLTEAGASWRPAPRRHNAWELAIHAAYWKHIVRQRLTGARDRFPFAGRNFFARPGGNRTWTDDLELIDAVHACLIEVVGRMSARSLRRVVHSGQTAEDNIRGIASHDVYHAGQIQLLKALARAGASTR